MTVAKEGKRAPLSPVYACNVAMWFREFAATFPATAGCDLGRQLLDAYLKGHVKLSSKSRNDRRATVRMFFAWCVKQDYLSATHRLLDADSMNRETVEIQEIEYYRPAKLRALLEAADQDLLPVIALGGLAGLRCEEIMRLDWGMHGVCWVISKSRLESLRRASADLSRSVQPWPCGWNLSEDVPARCGGRALMRLKKDREG